jgi:hypothetical protein
VDYFFFNSNLNNETKLKLTKWYNMLSEKDRNYVDLLRNESSDEAEYFSE